MVLEASDEEMCDALGITNQQLQILKVIYELEEKNRTTSPKNIQKTYTERYNQRIQKSNLSSQIRQLYQRKILSRADHSSTHLNFEGVKKVVDQRVELLEGKLEKLKETEEKSKKLLARISESTLRPIIRYLEFRELFERVTEACESADEIYIVARFPSILYPRSVVEGYGYGQYVQMLQKRCYVEKSLEIHYITALDTSGIISRISQVHHDKKKVEDLSHVTIENLEKVPKIHENLKIHYLPSPFGLDIILWSEKRKAKSFVFFIRDHTKDITAGLFIQSPTLAENCKQMLEREIGKSSLVSGKNQEIIEKTKRSLEKNIRQFRK